MTLPSSLQREDRSSKGALTILRTCMGLKVGESLLIIYDDRHLSSARLVRFAGAKSGANRIEFQRIGVRPTREPPTKIAHYMKESDVVILCVDERKTLLFGHSNARRDACKSGSRVGFLTQSLENVPSVKDLLEIRARSKAIATVLERTRTATIVTRENSRLFVKFIPGRSAIPLSSILTNPGDWGAIPDYSEAAISPMEGSAEGEVNIDSVIGIGGPSQMKLFFHKGELVQIQDGRAARKLQRAIETDYSSKLLCEIGVGSNHLRKTMLGQFDDKKILGAVHIGLGDNHTIGGKIRSTVHLDCLIAKPIMVVDGKKLVLV